MTSTHRALITGASSGIGKATALAFAEAGIDLTLVSRSRDKLEAVAQAIAPTGVKVAVYPLDLSLVEQVKPKLEAIAAEFQPPFWSITRGWVTQATY